MTKVTSCLWCSCLIGIQFLKPPVKSSYKSLDQTRKSPLFSVIPTVWPLLFWPLWNHWNKWGKNISKTSHVIGFALRKRRFQVPLYSGATEASEVMWRSKEWGVYFMIGAEKRSCLSIICAYTVYRIILRIVVQQWFCCVIWRHVVGFYMVGEISWFAHKEGVWLLEMDSFHLFFEGPSSESTTILDTQNPPDFTCLIIESNNYIYHKCLYLFTLFLKPISQVT